MSFEKTKITTDPDQLITEQEAAFFLGVSRRALQAWRIKGSGPQYIRISARCIRYRRLDLIEWSENHLRSSTSEEVCA